MADNKLNLLVQFMGIDKLSGSMRNIMGGAKEGTRSIRDLQREIRLMEKDLGRVNREMAKGGGAGLSMAHRELTDAIARSNAELDRQKGKLERIANVQARLSKVASFTGRAGTALTIGATTPILAFAKTAIDASRESARAVAQVEAGLASMGPAAGRSLAQLKSQAEALMNSSLFDDDEILQKVTSVMLTFGKVTGTTFDKAQQAAVDMSAKLGTDLQSSAIMLGKALNDPVKGVTALSRAGVSFTATQKEMIQSMVAAGNVGGAQNLILSEMQKQFAGAGAAARKADPGGALAISFGEFQQAVGDKLLPALTPIVLKVTELINAFGNLPGPVQNAILVGAGLLAILGPIMLGVSGVATAIGGIIAIAPAVGGAITLMLGPIGLFVAAIGVIGYLVYKNWDKIKAAFTAGVAWVKGVLAALPGWMKNIGSMMMNGLLTALNPALLAQKLISIAKSGITAFKNFFGIKSPSRLFMEMGGHMTEGLGIGLDRGRRGPVRAVGRMAGAVAGAGALALSPAAARTAAPPAGKIEIHVHQQPGEDAEALAKRVAELVERAQHQKDLRKFEDNF